MMNATETQQYINNLPFGTLKSPEREAYAKGVAFANQEFQDYCIDGYAISFTHAAAQVIWRKAWADGHSEGFNRVEDVFIELMNFLSDIEAVS